MNIKINVRAVAFKPENYTKSSYFTCLKSKKEINRRIKEFLEMEMGAMITDKLDSPQIDTAIENDLIANGLIGTR